MYFESIKSLNDLKSKYRELAMKNHPDHGGDAVIMREINIEYERLYHVWKNRKPVCAPVNMPAPRPPRTYKADYTGNNFDSRRKVSDMVNLLSAHVKKTCPDCSFRISRKNNKLYVALKSAPFNAWSDDAATKEARHQARYFIDPWADIKRGYAHIYEFPDARLSPRANALLSDIKEFVDKYNFRRYNSDFGYYESAFALHMSVGDGKRPFVCNN